MQFANVMANGAEIKWKIYVFEMSNSANDEQLYNVKSNTGTINKYRSSRYWRQLCIRKVYVGITSSSIVLQLVFFLFYSVEAQQTVKSSSTTKFTWLVRLHLHNHICAKAQRIFLLSSN